MAHQRLMAQAQRMDSLYTAFAQANTDSAKLVTSFAILDGIDEYNMEEQKRWLDTTASAAARMPKSRLAVLRKGYEASWHRGIGDFEGSYRLAIDCAKQMQAFKDSLNWCKALFEAGTSLSEFDPLPAIDLMRQATDLARRIGERELAGACLTNLSYALDKAGKNQSDDYRSTLEAGLELNKEMGVLEGILINNFNLLEYYLRKKDFAAARRCIADMQSHLKDTQDEYARVFPIFSEGLVLFSEGKAAAALPKYELAWATVERLGHMESMWEMYPMMIDVYRKLGRYDKAFEYSEGYRVMKDSMLSEEKNWTVQNLQTRYETEKKEARIAAQQADLARSRREKWGLAAGLVLLSGLSVMFWRQRRKTQAANLELAASNEQIAQKNQKLDLLMRELHHRVKNNLQLVSSLLRLQSRQVGDEGAAAAIKAGQLRVEAMSLIHQRLYREEGITLVNMQEFARDLVEKIAFAFGHRLEEMDIAIDFQPNELDVDKAMPLSLILNELLTNSFKYAFEGKARPAIKIQLFPSSEKLRLHYADNGPGRPTDNATSSSFGSKLIVSLSGQLGGQAKQWNEGGANFEVEF